MWRCAHCGVAAPHGTICPECGLPIDEALSSIARKVRGIKLGSRVGERWMLRGAKTGFIVGLILSMLLLAAMLIVHFVRNRSSTSLVETLGFTLLSAPVLVILFASVLAVLFLLYGAVIKPVWIALFCSIERFEQEYGSSKQ